MRKMKKLTYIDISLTILSFITFIADILSDLILAIQYAVYGYIQWSVLTLVFILMPSFVTMSFSLRWYKTDEIVSKIGLIFHALQGGILYRYIQLIKCLWRRDEAKLQEEYFRQQSDVCLLRIFESFMESAPQLVLQLYIMLSHENYTVWTTITAISSVVSLGWGIAAYTKAQRCSRADKKKLTITGAILQTVWRVLMISARIICLSVAATVMGIYIVIFLAAHFVCMLCWVFVQKTNFTNIVWEEYLFNFVMAFVYCFCFFNLKEGRSRWRIISFYAIILCENTGLLLTYCLLSTQLVWIRLYVVALVISCSIIGLICMVLYYALWHPVGPISWGKVPSIEEGRTEEKPNTEVRVQRCRTMKRAKSLCLPSNRASTENTDEINVSSITTQSDPVQKKGEVMCSIQDLLNNMSSFEELPDDDSGSMRSFKPHHAREKSLVRLEEEQKILNASPNKLGIPLVKTNCLTDSDCQSIRSANTEKFSSQSDVTVVATDSLLMERVVDEIVVNSTYIVDKPKDDYDNIYDAVTPDINYMEKTEASCHDYENIPAINIFRSVGLRHWKPYFDIEDRIHDYSTFKEKNRDFTLLSSQCTDPSGNTLSMSLPDLTVSKVFVNREYQCIHDFSPHQNNLMRYSSLDDLTNYEAIWVEPQQTNENGNESLCNLYYSNVEDLSRNDLTKTNCGSPQNKPLPPPPKNRRRKFSILLERFEHPNLSSLKTPIRRQISLHNRTAKALQAGMRVFHRPRVHTITPKKDWENRGLTIDNIKVKISPRIDLPVKNNFEKANELMPSSKYNPYSPMSSLDSTESAPKHSTPESNRHLPQISILSAVSSVVASPDGFEAEKASLRQISRELSGQSRLPLTEKLPYDCKNIFPKQSLTAIQEMSFHGCELSEDESTSYKYGPSLSSYSKVMKI